MRLRTLVAVLSVLVAACGLPPSAPQTYGVATYDRSTGDFWVNGRPYILPPDLPKRGVRSGDRVNVFYEQRGEDRVITRIEVLDSFVFRVL